MLILMISFLAASCSLLLCRFNAVVGIFFGFLVYHHSFLIVPLLSEDSNYSDWLLFSQVELFAVSVVFLMGVLLIQFLLAYANWTKGELTEIQSKDGCKTQALLAAGLLSVVVYFSWGNSSLSGFSKSELYSSSQGVMVLLGYPLAVLFAANYLSGSRLALGVTFISLLILSILFFSRSTLVLPVLSIVFARIYHRRIVNFISVKSIFAVVFIAFFAIYGKSLAHSVRAWDISPLQAAIQGTTVVSFAESLEGYYISEYVGEIVEDPAPYDVFQSLDAAFQIFPVPGLLGANSSSFSTYIGENYRPSADYGLAYTYLGEGYVVGGLFGVAIWALLLGMIAILIHRLIVSNANIWLRAWAIASTAIVCFYFPRNSLEIILVMLRLTALSAIVFWCIEKLFLKLTGWGGSRQGSVR